VTGEVDLATRIAVALLAFQEERNPDTTYTIVEYPDPFMTRTRLLVKDGYAGGTYRVEVDQV